MNRTDVNDCMETRIIAAARSLFVENGFAETSMSDIALRAGINRPALHYYFRTKEKMYRAVFGDIILSIVPKVFDILLQQDKPIRNRIEEMVEAYYQLFTTYPRLPLFMIREMNRDVKLLVTTAMQLQLDEKFRRVVTGLQEEMNRGRLRPVPFPFLFYSFYSLLTIPFLTKELTTTVFLQGGETFPAMLSRWKPYIVAQMEGLLTGRVEEEQPA